MFMISLNSTFAQYNEGCIDKPTFIKKMYDDHHASLFDYADYLVRTNIKKIEIEDGRLIFTSRDRGIRIGCVPGDFRIAPIEIFNFFDYEKNESIVMENLVSDGDNYFDIGANIGWYSINIAAARRFAKIYSFEPIPSTYIYLQKNIELNSVPNIKIHNFGFSNKSGEFPFYYYPEGSGNASLANVSGRTDIKTIQCKVKTFDNYIAETGLRVDFIKCDVEGAELFVFQGAIDTITRDKPIVFSEILRKWSAKFNYIPNEVFDLFRRLGYQVFVASCGNLREFDISDELSTETNYFFLHSQKHARQISRFQV